jgi:hypothetical protein
MQGEKFFIAIQLIGHRPLGHDYPSSAEFFMDLGKTALLLIA